MQSKLNLDRLLSFWTHEVEYTLGGELKPDQLAALIEGCINRFLPPELFQEGAVQDLKGCGPQLLLMENAPAPEYPEELLFLSGQYLSPSDPPGQAGSNPEDAQPHKRAFQLQLFTKFDKFLADNHISHALVSVSEGSWPERLNWQKAPTTAAASFDHIRIGLEVFHDKFTGPAGVAPIGDQRLFLEADPERFKLLLGAESLRDKTDLPLAKYELFDRLAAVLNEIFKFDLKSDYWSLMQHS
jgi:hypothetical protein